jgi:drug/metabolite transporter (DMT)-like permease
MWLRMMLLAFLFNGLSPFGLRILAAMGVGQELTPVYLFYWYVGGLAFVLIWALRKRERISGMAVLIGSGMALCGVLGQVTMGLALAYGAPGNVVFPLAVGANIFIVAAGGVLLFKERVGIYGKAGIAVGLLATVLLSIGE